jgi:predicted nucleic acid-binding protein
VAVATHLADKSALVRMNNEGVARRLGPMIEAGLVGTCGIIELEVRFSARSHTEHEQISYDRALGYESFPMPDEIWDRALQVQAVLSERGQLRGLFERLEIIGSSILKIPISVPSDRDNTDGWIEGPKIIRIGGEGLLAGSAGADHNVSVHNLGCPARSE